jgi:prolyl-tRNA editing enzyme YbaK/EbsC (Cys-tRNA(Pro) deacylase)
MTWPETVERVASYMRAGGAEARIEEFLAGTRTAADAARAVGCRTSQIVKSLVFDCDGRFVLALVPGDRRVDTDKLRLALGCMRAQPARAEQVTGATGYPPGAVAPFPLPGVERVLADPTLLSHRLVWIGAGSPRHMAAISPVDLFRLSRAQPLDVVAEA